MCSKCEAAQSSGQKRQASLRFHSTPCSGSESCTSSSPWASNTTRDDLLWLFVRSVAPTPAAKQQQPRTPNIIKAGMSTPPLVCTLATLLAIDFGCS
mmetsp:Transcript_111324/g.203962  ORF Transcript_111324/g.203962 Transcript_111324/m.203962 type:complete len:97 (+) Transcript_111324:51-341(+)